MRTAEDDPLPIDAILPQLLDILGHHTRAVLGAPPGAGKTTRVPLALLSASWLNGRRILMLEPRRLAARNAATFMSRQLGESLGETVGYRVRLDSRVGPGTRIEVVTEGVLTRLLQDDPELSRYGAVLFDEFHERSLQADLGLALCLDVQNALRDDLRLLVMSATLDSAPLAALLDGAPVLNSAGRSFPVEIRHEPPSSRDARLEAYVAAAIRTTLNTESGSILVFLPGSREIQRVAGLLADTLPADCRLAPLYGDLPTAEQDAAIQPPEPGRRKIVLATNIAETSLTIEGIRVVIDVGLERRPCFDPGSGMSRLRTQPISRAAANQRAGRAGRLEPGIAIRLWTAEKHAQLPPFSPPEISQADLAPLVLELAQWGCTDPTTLRWLDPPPSAPWAQARALLQELGALHEDGTPTSHGRAMHALGVHPRVGHMLLCAQALGWHDTACMLAALLGERDPLRGAGSDVGLRLQNGRHVRGAAWNRLREQARVLRHRLTGTSKPEPEAAAGILLAFAFPDRIAQRRPGNRPAFLLANGRGAFLADDDPLREAPLLVAAELDGEARESRIHLAAAIPRSDLETHFAERIKVIDRMGWDAAQEAVVATRQRRLGAIILSENPLPNPPPDRLRDGLLEGIRRAGLHALPWQESERQWQARVMLLQSLEPERWPTVDDSRLLATLEEWLAPFLVGMSRLAHLQRLHLQQALDTLLSYSQRRELAEQTPERITVPSGSTLALDYRAEGGPVLAVKLQEMFGTTAGPRIAHGRIALTLHLLSPARRPVQITRDLSAFWKGSYTEVRKDLRGRYPKHPWPEDPVNAAPTRHSKRPR